MARLEGFQRSYLRSLAHGLRPAIRVGKDGATDPVIAAIDEAMAARELIKVVLPGDRVQRQDLAATVAAQVGAECVGLVGRVAILFRPQIDPKKRRIAVPSRRGEDYAS